MQYRRFAPRTLAAFLSTSPRTSITHTFGRALLYAALELYQDHQALDRQGHQGAHRH